jgi:glycosyltransferase involved in cell wall biosynthesis
MVTQLIAHSFTVSIIVPNYNHEKYLDQRLQSIFDQTYQNYELIILDDSSSDRSTKVIDRYKNHPKVSHVVFNDINSGSPFKQWRKGLDLAKGEWIWIAESDDYCTPDLLSVLVNQATIYENVVLSYCQSKEVDKNGNGYRDMSWFTDKIDGGYWKKDYNNKGIKEINKSLWCINSIPNASAVIFKKSAYLNADTSFETMKMCGDWMLWIQVLRQGNIAFCATPHNYFRTHTLTTRGDNTNLKWKNRLEEEYTIAAYVDKLLPMKDRQKLKKRRLDLLLSYCSTFTNQEIKKLILEPKSFITPFPLSKFLAVYFTRLVYSKIKRLFLGKLSILAKS